MRAVFRGLALGLAVMMAGASGSVLADPHKNESGHGRGKGHHKYEEGRKGYKYEEKRQGGHVKREYQSGGCKYEYKSGPGGFKEEYKCGHPARFAGGPPPWAPAHGHRAKQGPGGLALPLDLDIGRCNREVIGQILGGAAGAAVGSQIGDGRGRIVAIVGGTIAGVLLGGEIGRAMDRADQLCFDQILEQAPDGQVVAWQDPDQGRRYTVTPRETFRTESGRYCREYTAESTIGGEPVQTYGTVCRRPDGSWEIVS